MMYYTSNTSPRDFSVYGSIGDFDDADCWSQEDDEIMQVGSILTRTPEPSCSKLMMSLVNVSLKLSSLNKAYTLIILLNKCE